MSDKYARKTIISLKHQRKQLYTVFHPTLSHCKLLADSLERRELEYTKHNKSLSSKIRTQVWFHTPIRMHSLSFLLSFVLHHQPSLQTGTCILFVRSIRDCIPAFK